MTTLESATLVPALIDEIRDKLRNAPAPLKLAEIARGLKKSRSETAAEFERESGCSSTKKSGWAGCLFILPARRG